MGAHVQFSDCPVLHGHYEVEKNALIRAGFLCNSSSMMPEDIVVWRGHLVEECDYPKLCGNINTAEAYANALYIDRWLQCIAPLTFETLLVPKLDINAESLVRDKNWTCAFVKNRTKSLFLENACDSCWPNHSWENLSRRLSKMIGSGAFALRKFDESVDYRQEVRYWVIRHSVYTSRKIIPDSVYDAVERLRCLNNSFYTIDACGDTIIEINPGEVSYIGDCNSLDDWVSWLSGAFLRPHSSS